MMIFEYTLFHKVLIQNVQETWGYSKFKKKDTSTSKMYTPF